MIETEADFQAVQTNGQMQAGGSGIARPAAAGDVRRPDLYSEHESIHVGVHINEFVNEFYKHLLE